MTAKKLGIWMDHVQAHLTEFTTNPMKTTTVLSAADHEEKEAIGRGEHHMHTKEQYVQGEYYKALGERIFKYKEVILFGPTSAKDELVNYLSNHRLFRSVKIRTQSADKMTENQLHAFVKEYFSTH